jgi:hypothetical protein
LKQSIYGLLLFVFLAAPPVANLLESIMIIHMHMQMPLLVVAGFFMARILLIRYPRFFDRWNMSGVPGIMLFLIITSYWMLPRTMDEAIASEYMEAFKFISLPFMAGIPLRDSWRRLGNTSRNAVLLVFTALFSAMGALYITAPTQLCNNYLLIEQITLGWGFITMAICLTIYVIYASFTSTQ